MNNKYVAHYLDWQNATWFLIVAFSDCLLFGLIFRTQEELQIKMIRTVILPIIRKRHATAEKRAGLSDWKPVGTPRFSLSLSVKRLRKYKKGRNKSKKSL